MSTQVIITLTNFRCNLRMPTKELLKMKKELADRNPSAYHMRRYMPKGWDGMQHYITDKGSFKIGQLDRIVEWLLANTDFPIKVDDRRQPMKPMVIPDKVGNKIPRPYQKEAVESILNNKIGEVHHRVGVINAATNAGKTLMMAMFFEAFQRKCKMIMLINDADLYNQFKEELPELLGDDVGFIRGQEFIDNKFVVAMVPTLARNIAKFKNYLLKFEIVAVDECDLGGSSSYKKVLANLSQCQVRVGLSGSIYMEMKNNEQRFKWNALRDFFGDQKFVITKREMVDIGHSTELVIKIIPGNMKPGKKGDYDYEYNELITNNVDRHEVVYQRLMFNMKYGRVPAVIMCRYHEHIEQIYEYLKEKGVTSIMYVHGGVKDKMRKDIIRQFRDGKFEVLVASMILKRGKNFPLLRYICNAAGGDSHETLIQIMGRGERKHESKKKVYIDDLYDRGHYLQRHSKHRVGWYKREKFKVIKLI